MEVNGQPLYSMKWSKHQEGVLMHGCKASGILNLSYNKGNGLALTLVTYIPKKSVSGTIG
jgi:hypothetical protein